jgi:acyl-CoA dehydrogenase
VTRDFGTGPADGPTELHKMTVGREVLRRYSPTEDVYLSCHLPRLGDASVERHQAVLERHGRLDDPLQQHATR